MTTIHEQSVACGVCGHAQTVTELGSTNAFGAMDLDTRPPEMQRSTMDMWVFECAQCGYVSADLGRAHATSAHCVSTTRYREELGNATRDRLATRFVCASLIDEAADDLVAAGWRRVHAAWACDDAGEQDDASRQRLAALALFERATAAGHRAMPDPPGGSELLCADLARRAGEFERAGQFCAAGLAQPGVEPFVTRLLQFETALTNARDVACHTVAEIDDAPEAPQVH